MELYRLQRSHLAKTTLLLVGLCREIDSAIPHGGRRLPLGGVTLDLQRNGRQRKGLFSNQDMGSGKVGGKKVTYAKLSERSAKRFPDACATLDGKPTHSMQSMLGPSPDTAPAWMKVDRRRGPPRCGATSASSPCTSGTLGTYQPRDMEIQQRRERERERADEQMKQHFHLRSAYCIASRPGVTTGHTLVR